MCFLDVLSQHNDLVTGRIVEILANSTGKRALVILDLFHVLSERHGIFGMPMLARRNEETTYVVIPATVRLLLGWCLYLTLNFKCQGLNFLYNVQHDCPLSKCTASGKQPILQERAESGQIEACIEHQPLERFIINTHAFHNAHLIRASLPRSLVSPIPLYPDRQRKHLECAERLRVAQQVKRTAAKARKNQATPNPGAETDRESNKRQRLETDGGMSADVT